MSHDQFDILGLKARIIDFLTIVLLFFLLGFRGVDSLALSVVVSVVVAGVGISTAWGSVLSGSKLLSGGCLSLRVQVLNLGLTEDTDNLSEYISSIRMPGERETNIHVLLVGDL